MHSLKPRIVGLTGRAGSGKTYLANLMRTRVNTSAIVSFAAPIKEMIHHMLGVDVIGKHETPPQLCGKTVREAYQTLGTEWGRNCIGPDVWVAVAVERMKSLHDRYPGLLIIVDDVRFDNEVAAIRAMGGKVYRVLRDEGVEVMDHVSEHGITEESGITGLIHNGTPNLEFEVSQILNSINA